MASSIHRPPKATHRGSPLSIQSVVVFGHTVMATGGYVAAHHLANRLGLFLADIALTGIGIGASAARLAANLHADARGIIACRPKVGEQFRIPGKSPAGRSKVGAVQSLNPHCMTQ